MRRVSLRLRQARGQALVEALASLVIVAMAAAVVAAAATTGLRAVRRAETLERVVAVAARELSGLQSQGAPPGESDRTVNEEGLGNASLHQAIVLLHDDLSELSVTVTAERPSQRVTLRTRMLAGN